MAKHSPNDNNGNSDSDAARQAAVDFLYGRIDYERALSVQYCKREFKLGRMRRLLTLVGDPQRGMNIVHVAGTKGKGSTASLLSGILTAAGFRMGLFTSPHLNRIEERMAVDAQPCTAGELVELVEQIRPAVATMDRETARQNEKTGDDRDTGPTYFEITTAMGLLHFARHGVDLAVLEVGLGGRLDSTNVCRPLVSVITSISLDHTRQLGDSLAAIAREKAGIVKPGVPVVSGVTKAEPRDVIREVCRGQNATLIELDRDFSFQYLPPNSHQNRGLDYSSETSRYHGLRLGLIGRHQAANAAVALAVIEQLRQLEWKIPDEAVRHGLAKTRCPGRVEVLAQRPLVIVDTAHNRDSIEALLASLDECQRHKDGQRLLLFATTQEKDIEGMLAALYGHFDRVIFTQYLNNPRGVPPQELATLWAKIVGEPCDVYQQPIDAWQAARRWATPDDLICITGSFSLVSELRPTITALFDSANEIS